MPKMTKKSGGTQGESGYTPTGPTGSKGAYGYSARTMGGASTPHMQDWNSYRSAPERDGSIKGGRGMKKSGNGSDY